MNGNIAVFIAVLLFGYGAVNGSFMIVAPMKWAVAVWAARGVYSHEERRRRLVQRSERARVRVAGGGLLLLSLLGLLTIISFYT